MSIDKAKLRRLLAAEGISKTGSQSKLRKNLDAYGKELMASNQIMSSAIKDLQAGLKSTHELGMNMRRLAATPFGEDPQDFKHLYQEVVRQLTFVQRMLMSYRYVERVHDLGDEYDVAGTLGVADSFNDQQDMERYWGTDYDTSKSFRAASSKKTAYNLKSLLEIEESGTLTDPETRADVSDWGVNTFRDQWRSKIFPAYVEARTPDFDGRALQKELLEAEFARIRKGNLDLKGYIRASRAGSPFLLSRKARIAIWAHYASHEMRNSRPSY